MGWLITLGILVLLAVLPLGVRVRYDEDGVRLDVKAGLLKILILPAKKKPAGKAEKKKPVKETKAASSTPPATGSKSAAKPEEKPKKGGSVLDFLPLVRVALNLLNDFRRKLRVERLELKIILAGGDPAKLAINYGRTWAAVGNLMPQLERILVIKKRDINIECDFTAPETLITARVDVTITLGRLLGLLALYGFRGIKEFLNIRKKRKGGVTT